MWNPQTVAFWYHLYRGDLSDLGYDDFGACVDALVADPDPGDQLLVDTDLPPTGDGFAYEIVADDQGGAGGNQGTLGFGSCAERTKFAVCP